LREFGSSVREFHGIIPVSPIGSGECDFTLSALSNETITLFHFDEEYLSKRFRRMGVILPLRNVNARRSHQRRRQRMETKLLIGKKRHKTDDLYKMSRTWIEQRIMARSAEIT
jgi:hypothetical protein